MAEGTVLQTMLGAVVSISASLPATYNAAGYAASAMVYTTCGSIESYGNHGVVKQVPQFTAVNDGVVQKFAGTKDYGNKAFVLGYMPSDTGQDLMRAAAESQNRYSVKIAYPLRAGEATAEIHYLDVIVAKAENIDGDANAIRKMNVDMAICRAPVIVPAT